MNLTIIQFEGKLSSGGAITGSQLALTVALRTVPGMNTREHWRVRAKRVKAEKALIGWNLRTCPRPATPCTVLLTRIAPSNGLDDDNLVGALKSCRDSVAEWLGVDDKHHDIVRYENAQQRGPCGVRIEVATP